MEGMSITAERVADQLAGLASAGLDLDTYSAGALEILRRAVPFESACLASTDPSTQLITRTHKIDLPDAKDPEFARYEYGVEDVNKFADLAQRDVPVGVLSLDTGGRPDQSARYREFLVPYFDQGNELRAAFQSDGLTWGLLGLYRPTSGAGFSPAEASFVGRVASTIAEGLRASLVASVASGSELDHGPAVLVVDSDDQVVRVSGAAEQRLAELGGDAWGQLPMSLLSIVGAARGFAAGTHGGAPRARVRMPSGQWLVVHASPLAGPDGAVEEVVITLEEARPPDVVPLVVAALGLTAREREVVQLVLSGASTQEIAKKLHLSPYTVQDHLKAIFSKAGVNSRRELTSKVFFEQYAPRIGGEVGPSGWFRDP
jgi:DNA-binding CsgD family transcriptional regulator